MTREGAIMRMALANVGILLDDPPEQAPRAAPVVRPAPAVDRDLVREILIDARAPSGDIEWLVASCPSVADARDYRAPPREAWCPACDGPQPTDIGGCITCRTRDTDICPV